MSNNRIKLIIFDLDGTLVDAYPAITSSFNHTMAALGYKKRAAGVIRMAVGWGDDNLLKPFIRKKDLTKALGIYRRHHRSALAKQSTLIKGAGRVLSYLKAKGYKLAVASNRPTKFSRILIKGRGLSRYFDFMLCADKLKKGKPHPEILNRVIRRFSLTAKEALYVGDMHIDAQAGRRAGMKTVIVSGGSSTRGEINKEKPFLIINSLNKLLCLL